MQTVQAQKNKTFSHIEKYELSKLRLHTWFLPRFWTLRKELPEMQMQTRQSHKWKLPTSYNFVSVLSF